MEDLICLLATVCTLNPLPFLAPFSSLFVFPHVLLIIIGKTIFHLFPQLPLPLSFFRLFLFLLFFLSFFFYSSSILSYISAPVILFPILQISCTSAFFSLLFCFFQIFLLFCCFNPFSHSLALLSLSLSLLALLSFHLFSPFFLLVPFFFFLYFILFSFSTSYPYYTNVMISSVSLVISFLFSCCCFSLSFLSAAFPIQQSFSCSSVFVFVFSLPILPHFCCFNPVFLVH